VLRKFIKDLAVYAPSQFLPALTAFITTPILTRLFAPAEYGWWALTTSISTFLVALAVSGFGSAVLRFYPAYKTKATLNVFFATISASAGAAILSITFFGCLVWFVFKPFLPVLLVQYFYLVVLIFIAQSIFSVFIATLRAQGKSAAFTTFQLLNNYGGLGVGLLLVLLWQFRVDGLLWGTFIIAVLLLPVLIFVVTKQIGIHLQYFQLPDALQIWDFAWPLALGNVAMWGLRVSDLFIISLFRAEHEVGIYSVSYNISAKSIELLVSLFMLSISPLVYKIWETEGRQATEKTLTMITRVYLVFCLPAAVGLSILAFPFIALLAAPEYYAGSRIVGFVVFSSFIWGLANIAMMGLTIKKQARFLAINQILAAAVHIGLQLLFVPRFGYFASALSTVIGYSVLLVLQTLGSRPHLTWKFPFRTLRNTIGASGLMGLVAWGVYGLSGNGSNGSPVFLLLSILVAVPVYFIVLWLFGEANPEEKQKVFQLLKKTRGGAE